MDLIHRLFSTKTRKHEKEFLVQNGFVTSCFRGPATFRVARFARRWLSARVLSLGLLVLILPSPLTPAPNVLAAAPSPQSPDPAALPQLTEPVNDFAHVIDSGSKAEMERLIRALEQTTGDSVVVATVPTIEPYADINEYAVKLFENHGRGIGQKGKDNGVLVLLALKERRARIEPGYGLEQWITDGYSGETSRMMAPLFREGRYGEGLLAGVERIVGRIAEGRNVTLEGVRAPQAASRRQVGTPFPISAFIWIVILLLVVSRIGRRRRRNRFWGGGPWSGWSSGVGPFGGGWSSGGGGGFGGGFGGFGGGRSGGGGGGASW
jgi:uncharacterized protein